MFVFISGKRCTGKDTLAKKIHSLADNTIIDSFANLVKYEISVKYNLDYNKLINDYEYKCKYRQILIQYAEAQKKNHGTDIWVKRLIDKYNTEKHIIIVTDLRFKVELEYIKKINAKYIIIRLEISDETRKSYGWVYDEKIDTTRSEIDLDNTKFENILNDNYTIDDVKSLLC